MNFKHIFALNVHGKYQGKYRRKHVKEWCIMGDILMVCSTIPQGSVSRALKKQNIVTTYKQIPNE